MKFKLTSQSETRVGKQNSQDEYDELPNNLIFEPNEIDCLIAVMLKILDGKCKMPTDEKLTMSKLYDRYAHLPSSKLDASYRMMINKAKNQLDIALQNEIYEQRVLAETMISRPVMKCFKARLRKEGVLPPK